MSSCTTTWQTFKVFQRKIALQFALWPKVSIITSSALILWTLRAGSSFFTVLLGLGKCITAVPAAMLEWLWQNLRRIHDAMRSEIRSWMGKSILGKNNPAQYFSDFALLSSRPGAWNLEEGVQRSAGSLSYLRTRRRFLFFGRRKKSRGRARGEKERRLLSPLRSLRASSPIGRGKQVSRNRAFSRGSLRLPNSTATLRVPLVRL